MSDRYEPRHVRPKPFRRQRPLRLAAILSFVILVAMASMPVRSPQRQFVVIPPPELVAPLEQFPILADPPLGFDEPEQPEERSGEQPSTPEVGRPVPALAVVLVPAAAPQPQPVPVLTDPTSNPLAAPSPTPVAMARPARSPTAAAAIPNCHPEPPTGPRKTKEPKRG